MNYYGMTKADASYQEPGINQEEGYWSRFLVVHKIILFVGVATGRWNNKTFIFLQLTDLIFKI